MIKRMLQEKIEKSLYAGKVIIIYGARRVGKTTLSKQIIENQKKTNAKKCIYLNCESINVKPRLETMNEIILKDYLGDYNLVVLDEAQNINKIGNVLKLLVDTYPKIQIIATGSSSFELSNQVGEPLVGRSKVFKLYPFSISELSNKNNLFEMQGQLENILRFGLYPQIYSLSEEEAKDELDNMASNYLYKDILAFENIRNSAILLNILRYLALQIGSEVSYHEIGQNLGINHLTIKKYIDLLEKCFIVFQLSAFSKNKKNEISKSKKIYFYDLGIRNALINNFNTLDIRNDRGALWENFCITERIKNNEYTKNGANRYFWRTYSGEEVDYIEEIGTKIIAFEFKYGPNAKAKKLKKFLETYPKASINIINRENWFEFLGVS